MQIARTLEEFAIVAEVLIGTLVYQGQFYSMSLPENDACQPMVNTPLAKEIHPNPPARRGRGVGVDLVMFMVCFQKVLMG